MDNANIIAFVGLGAGLLFNLIGVAFSYGSLVSQVKGIRDAFTTWQTTTDRRLENLEKSRVTQAQEMGEMRGRAERRHQG